MGGLAETVEDAVRETRRLGRWELVHFSLWEHDTPKADGDVFEVLHLSAPGRDRLPRGRQW